MKILHLSDTHGLHRRLTHLPEADVVVHTGDFCMAGTESEAIDFLQWFCDLPHRHKVFVCGNHDDCLYGATIDGLDPNCHYLCCSGVEIEGVRFYGVPLFVQDCIDGRLNRQFAGIPAATDVLLTHMPPHGILDSDGSVHYGSDELLTRVKAVQPRLHLFGHTHAANGRCRRGATVFVNSAVATESYDALQRPHVLTL